MPASYKRNPGQERIRALLTSGRRYNLVYGGSRSGKTFELLGTVCERAVFAPESRHLVVRQEGTSAKRAIVKGTWPEMIRARFPGLQYEWREQDRYFALPNGSTIWVGGLNDDAALEKLLGNEYATIYLNEASEAKYQAFTLLRSRLAQTVKDLEGNPMSQRFYVDLNPTTRQHWTYRCWIDGTDPETQAPLDMDNWGFCVVNPMDNVENLSADFIADLRSLPDRARKRFYDGSYVEDLEDALWRRDIIRRAQSVPDLSRVVVAVDPAISNEAGSDETGIVTAGVDAAGNAYILDDASGRYSPADWARQAIAAFDFWKADLIVAEANQGGAMVEQTLRSLRPNAPVRLVHASRGKVTRAEPIAALYERRKVFHAGEFPELEDQMCSFTIGFDRRAQGWSPDRVDALVWAMTNLFSAVVTRRDPQEYYDEAAEWGRDEVTGY